MKGWKNVMIPDKSKIFVLMPFDKKLDNTYYAIQQAAKQANAQVERADNPITTETILRRVYRGIEEADLVLADLTGKNANVFYEIGYAHALGKPVAFLAPDLDVVPFDLKNYPIMTYSCDSPVNELVDALVSHLATALMEPMDLAPLRSPLSRALKAVSRMEEESLIFRNLLASTLERFSKEVSQWVSGTLTVEPEETREKGIEILKCLRQRGFATFLVPVQSYWESGTEYLEAARHASRKQGVSITRVYIAFEKASLANPSLRECVRKDLADGIKALICLAEDVLDREAIKDFGIWDDEIACLVDVAVVGRSPRVTGCSFSTDPDKLALACRWKDNILSAAEPASIVLARFGREGPRHQPLAESAGEMARLAERNCHGSYLNREDCLWYHGSWQFLRIIDMVSTPDWHSKFYETTISKAATSMSQKRILICGTADYGMLAHVVKALGEESLDDFELVILDSCLTPLRACEWYAERFNLNIRTFQGDARDMAFREDRFGMIVTDAFLTRFTQPNRKQIVKEWNRVLSKGGIVVTTVRLNSEKTKITGTETDIDRFVSRSREKALKQSFLLPCSFEDIEEMARDYAKRIVSYPLSKEDLRELFTSEGFSIKISLHATEGEFRKTTYAHVVATQH